MSPKPYCFNIFADHITFRVNRDRVQINRKQFLTSKRSWWKAPLWGNLIAPCPNWKPLDFNHIKNDCKGFTEETVRGSLMVLFFVILTPNKMFIQSPSNPCVKPGVKIHLVLTDSSLVRFFCLHHSRQRFRNLAFEPGRIHNTPRKVCSGGQNVFYRLVL